MDAAETIFETAEAASVAAIIRSLEGVNVDAEVTRLKNTVSKQNKLLVAIT